MTTYNTGNPVGPDGSNDPRDLNDNAQVLDKLMNSPGETTPSRLGVDLYTWDGIRQNLAPLGKRYNNLTEANNAIESGEIANGAYFFVRPTVSDVLAYEYRNVSGVATLAGGLIYNGTFFNSIPRANLAQTFEFNGPIPGTTIASAVNDGNYYGSANGGYTDLPPQLPVNNAFQVKVSELSGNGRYKLQQIINFSSPGQVFSRFIDLQEGTSEPWSVPVIYDSSIITAMLANGSVTREKLADRYSFNGNVAAGAALTTAVKNGQYYGPANGGYPDLPAWFATNHAFTLDVLDMSGGGRFIQQEFIDFSSPTVRSIRVIDLQNNTVGAWGSQVPAANSITRSILVDRFNFNGSVTTGSFNALVKDGSYTAITASMTEVPPAPGSWFVEVINNNNDWCKQTATLLTDTSVVYSRIIRPAIGNYPAWKPAGSSSGSTVFAGKKIAFLGDSLTEQGTHPTKIAARLGATGLKMGFGGCRMGKHSNAGYDGMCMYNIAKAIGDNDFTALIAAAQQVYDESSNPKDDNRPQANLVASTDWTTVDYAVIAFGTNDFGGSNTANNVIGNVTDFTPDGSTFCGSVNYVINRLLTRNPKMRLVFISPIWRQKTPTAQEGIEGGSDVSPNLNGDYLLQFVDALSECCKQNHVEVWDGYRTSGIGQLTASAFILPMPDGLHPTADGYQLLADKEAAFLLSKF